ncbi:histidine kinase dimerization/phosphoacceptor domain -containing protein [Chelativorans sp. ZYF759]|uniref:histidine kinase dimerization/phosphoacceptor domain -containing protein n=1 Tax=Chelativorans sp. ZYF759 TaxID=2692213 RepID=UPI001FEFCE1F|nr:histidine kinase dimerization/phosphoacceptor domain -containing protein [Chelativorans sp. ZYF759]
MNQPESLDLTACDREPIHLPGAIQPHGAMLVVDLDSGIVRHQAGDTGLFLGVSDTIGRLAAELFGETWQQVAAPGAAVPQEVAFSVSLPHSDRPVDLSFSRSEDVLIVEVEHAPAQDETADRLHQLERASIAFERAGSIKQLCEVAAVEFRLLCGFDRVMIYRFLEDGAGVVLAEDKREDDHSFLNHHFPATDIPRQARELYVRNLVRCIPDITYRPAPLQPALEDDGASLDMSDSVLRSVSPIHLQYMKNMGVGASASVSIVRDGGLWGLIACHNAKPRLMPAGVRIACRVLAGALARQIKAREETDTYRERVRLRTFEDDIVALLSREGTLDEAISNHLGEIMRMLDADGVAVLRGRDFVSGGECPTEQTVRAIAGSILDHGHPVFSSSRLARDIGMPHADAALAAGLLAITLSASEPWVVMWFRAEKVEVVKWAGNPHKATASATDILTPRASFDAWSEIVRGRSRRWTMPEIEAAGRLRHTVTNVWQNRRIQDLNRQLLDTLDQKDILLREKDFLLREVNHRVQNSLQLVSSFLALQASGAGNDEVSAAIAEARRRIAAVSLVHRRLYSSDQLEIVDAARYVDELLDDLLTSLGPEWNASVVRDLEPIMIKTDRAVSLGLILTELVINANKYAYGGAAGPLRVVLADDDDGMRLCVIDQGGGRKSTGRGFGSRMIEVLVSQLGGTLDYLDNRPGTNAVLVAPIDRPN